MMRVIFCLVMVVTMFVGAQAFAQTDTHDEPCSRYYNFEDFIVDGVFRSPDEHLIFSEPKWSTEYQRLSVLSTSFLPKIQESAGVASLH